MSVLSVEKLRKEVEAGQVRSAYLVVGESTEERERVFRLLEEAAVEPAFRDMCVNTFDGEQSKAVQILETLYTVPFLGETRLVFVRRFDQMPTEEQEKIADACTKGFKGAVLLLSATTIDRRKKATQRLLEAATLVECSQPEGEGLVAWLINQAADRGLTLQRDGATILAGQGGANLDGLSHELDKLVAYLGAGATATADDVAAVMAASSPEAAQNEIFQLCDATAEGRLQAVLMSIDKLLGTGANPIYVVTMLARHYRRLLAVKSYGGRDAVQVDKALGLRSPRFATQRLMRQASGLSQTDIEEGLIMLLQADMSLKRGALPRTTLERVAISLAHMGGPS